MIDSRKSLSHSRHLRCLSGSSAFLKRTKAAEIVLRMQHLPTTFFETVQTPKKAAHA
jgi:hypothetical protein